MCMVLLRVFNIPSKLNYQGKIAMSGEMSFVFVFLSIANQSHYFFLTFLRVQFINFPVSFASVSLFQKCFQKETEPQNHRHLINPVGEIASGALP